MIDVLDFIGLANLEFKDPTLLLVLLLAPIAWWLAEQRGGSITYSSTSIAKLAPGTWRIRVRWLPGLCFALAVACLAIASAGPRSGDETTRVKREGIAIMLVVDRSGSMDARDFVAEDSSVNRLDAVKRVLRDFVLGSAQSTGRPDDLIGLVAFGTFADSVSPLTLDHANLASIVGQLKVAQEQTEAATAIGEGLGLAVERLRAHPAKAKVVVLLTDGVNNAGNLEPSAAAELAQKYGIKVYTVGAGSNGLAPIPVPLGNGRYALRPMRVAIDEDALKAIGERTGGTYFNARDADGLARVYAQIDALERSEITETRYLQYREHFTWLACAALLLVLIGELLNATLLRRLP